MKFAGLVVLASVAPLAIGQVYKCKEGATTVFSAMPCEPNARAIDVRPASGASRVEAPAGGARPGVESRAGSPGERMRRQADAMQYERELKEVLAQRERLVRDRDDELDALRRKKFMANNNLAGATWLQSISAEMQVVSDNYAQKIRDVDALILRYKTRLSGD